MRKISKNLYLKNNIKKNKKQYDFINIIKYLKYYNFHFFNESININIELNKFFLKIKDSFILDFCLPYSDNKINNLLIIYNNNKLYKKNLYLLNKYNIKNIKNIYFIKDIIKGFNKFKCLILFPDCFIYYKLINKINFIKKLIYDKLIFISCDIKNIIYNLKLESKKFKINKYGILNINIGKCYYNLEFLKFNFFELIKNLNFILSKSLSYSNNFYKKITLSNTMSLSSKILLENIYNFL